MITPASPITWLPLIKSRIMSVTGLPTTRVTYTIRRNPPMPEKQDVLLVLGGFERDEGQSEGAGRVSTILHRRLRVVVRTQLAIDPQESDELLLLDPILGHLQLEDALVNALEDFQPVTSAGDWVLTEPIKLTSGEDPGRAEHTDRGESVLFCVCSYLPVLDQTYQ